MPSYPMKTMLQPLRFLLFFVSTCLVLHANPLESEWNCEGFISRGNSEEASPVTRIQGTVKFTESEIQFSTNAGDFKRRASMGPLEFERKIQKDIRMNGFVIENALFAKIKAKLTQVDEETWILSYGKTDYRTIKDGLFIGTSLLDRYEWIGVVLTKRSVSSVLHSFDDPNLWLDVFKGQSIEMEDSTYEKHIRFETDSQRIGIEQESGLFYLVGDDDRLPLEQGEKLRNLSFDEKDENRELILTNPWIGTKPDGSKEVIGTTEHWVRSFSDHVSMVHLGAGRVFWFQAFNELGDTIHKDTEENPAGPTLSYVFSSEMECGVLSSRNAAVVPEIQFAQAALAKSDDTASSTVLRGKVTIIRNGEEFPLRVGDWVKEGDIVRTGEKSFVKFIFIDKSQMNIGPESEMKIEKFTGKESGIYELIKGYIRSQVTKDYMQIQETNKTKLFIKTKNAVMGVRGTEFDVRYTVKEDVGTTKIQMYEGAVEVMDANDGKPTLLQDTQRISIAGPAERDLPTGPEIVVLGRRGEYLIDGTSKQKFRPVTEGGSGRLSFQIRNVGPAVLADLQASIEGVHAEDFQIVRHPARAIPGGNDDRLVVEFRPTTKGLRTARLKIRSSDKDEDPFVVGLSGECISTGPSLVVEWPRGSSITSGSSRKFGSVAVGDRGAAKTVLLRSTGTKPLEGVRALLSGENKDEFTVTTAPASMAPGESASLKVSFRPKDGGRRSAFLEISSNDPTTPLFKIQLQGEGLESD